MGIALSATLIDETDTAEWSFSSGVFSKKGVVCSSVYDCKFFTHEIS
jgi:hypothetical protein